MDRVLSIIIICFVSFTIILNSCANAGLFSADVPVVAQATTPGTEDAAVLVTPVIITQAVPITVPVSVPVFVTQMPDQLPQCADRNPDEMDEIRVGALVPLSGESAFLAGFAMQTAFNIAAYHINAKEDFLDKPLRLVVGDTRGNPDVGRELAERLITQDCVVGLVGVYHSRVAQSVKEVAHEYGVPILFSESFDDAITEDFYPEVFRLAPTFSMVVDSDEAWLQQVGDYNEDGAQSVVFVMDPDSYSSVRFETLAQRLVEDEVETTLLFTDPPARNISGIVQRIAALEQIPDVIIIGFNTAESLQLQGKLSSAGLRPGAGTLIVNKQVALESEQFWQQLPDETYTLVDRMGPWHTTVNEMGQTFASSYQQLMQRWPPSYAFAAHDTLYLLAAAIDASESLTTTNIIAALESIDIELASGRYYFPYNSQNPPDGDGVPKYMWHQWPDPPLLLLQYTEQAQNSSEMAVVWPELYSNVSGPFVRPSVN